MGGSVQGSSPSGQGRSASMVLSQAGGSLDGFGSIDGSGSIGGSGAVLRWRLDLTARCCLQTRLVHGPRCGQVRRLVQLVRSGRAGWLARSLRYCSFVRLARRARFCFIPATDGRWRGGHIVVAHATADPDRSPGLYRLSSGLGSVGCYWLVRVTRFNRGTRLDHIERFCPDMRLDHVGRFCSAEAARSGTTVQSGMAGSINRHGSIEKSDSIRFHGTVEHNG